MQKEPSLHAGKVIVCFKDEQTLWSLLACPGALAEPMFLLTDAKPQPAKLLSPQPLVYKCLFLEFFTPYLTFFSTKLWIMSMFPVKSSGCDTSCLFTQNRIYLFDNVFSLSFCSNPFKHGEQLCRNSCLPVSSIWSSGFSYVTQQYPIFHLFWSVLYRRGVKFPLCPVNHPWGQKYWLVAEPATASHSPWSFACHWRPCPMGPWAPDSALPHH